MEKLITTKHILVHKAETISIYLHFILQDPIVQTRTGISKSGRPAAIQANESVSKDFQRNPNSASAAAGYKSTHLSVGIHAART